MTGETKCSTATDRNVLDRRHAIRKIVILGGAAGLALLGLSQLWPSRFEEKPTPTSTPTSIKPVNYPPIADFQYAPRYVNPSQGQDVHFFDDSIDPDDDPLACRWHIDNSFANGNKDFSTRLSSGEHHVRLTVSDGKSEDCVEKYVTVEPDQLYPVRNLRIPIKGINYFIGAHFSGGWFTPPSGLEMDEYLEVVRNDLGCNAVKLVGDFEDTMLECAEKAIGKEFEIIILSPRYFKKSPYEDVSIDDHVERVTAFSKKAEQVREKADSIVLCLGEELEISVRGIGRSATYKERIEELYTDWNEELRAYVKDRLNFYLRKILVGVRENFQGRVTYSPSDATRLFVKWNELGFDIVGPMVYYTKKWDTEKSMLKTMAELKKYGKPVYVTEFGCATYEGASMWGGDGWRQYRGEEYSEEEQAQSIMEHVNIFDAAKVDGIFLHTFIEWDEKSYGILRYRGQSRARRKLGFYMYKSFMPS